MSDPNQDADEPIEGTPEEQDAEYQRQLAEEALHGHPALAEEDDDGV